VTQPVRPVVVAVVGSPRRRSNTAALVAAALEELEAAGAACETISLRDLTIAPCLAHSTCGDLAACVLKDDAEAVLARMYVADCLVLGTPVYYENVSAQLKALMDRNLNRFYREERLRAKAVGLIAVTGETGLQDALDAMRRYVALSSVGEMPVHTCGGCASDEGEAAGDEALLAGARAMGRALAGDLGLTPV